MDKFVVLFVEDQEKARKDCRKAFPHAGPVHLLTARSLDEALPLIADNFIHLALVDIDLDDNAEDEGREKNEDGLGVLARLSECRPACRRYAYTAKYSDYLRMQFRDKSPNPTIQGVIPKTWGLSEVEFIQSRSDEWLDHPVRADGLDAILTAFRGKLPPPHPLRDELDYLASKIFGQGGTPTSIESIELDMLVGGRSRSVVVLGQPKDASGRVGIWTVIKFSSRRQARKEYQAYCQHVRYMLPVSTRVELLDYFEADTLGAMCYSFAGGASQDEIVSLERLIRDEDESTIDSLRALHDSLGASWYVLDEAEIDQVGFVNERFGVGETEVSNRVQRFALQLAGRLRGSSERDGIRFDNRELRWPTAETLLHSELRQRPRCTIHGDLHAGNVLVRRGTRQIVLIDYQYTGPGPAYLDFSALDASPRVFTTDAAYDQTSVVERMKAEAKVWKTAWAAPVRSAPPTKLPFWARVSFAVVVLARERFPDMTPKDYAGTCLLWALRVFKLDTLEDVPRVNLFVWISHLLNVLRTK